MTSAARTRRARSWSRAGFPTPARSPSVTRAWPGGQRKLLSAAGRSRRDVVSVGAGRLQHGIVQRSSATGIVLQVATVGEPPAQLGPPGLGSGRDEAIPWSTPLLLASQDNPEAFVSEWRAEMKDRRGEMKIRSGGKTAGTGEGDAGQGTGPCRQWLRPHRPCRATPTSPARMRASSAGRRSQSGAVRTMPRTGSGKPPSCLSAARPLLAEGPPQPRARYPQSPAPSHRRTDHGGTRALRRTHLGTGRVGRRLHRVHDRRGGEARGRDHRPRRQQRGSGGGSTFDLKARNGMPVRFEGLRLVVSHVKSK